MEVISGISVKKRFNNTFFEKSSEKNFKMQSGVIFCLPIGYQNIEE
jgi:hypothetical protein